MKRAIQLTLIACAASVALAGVGAAQQKPSGGAKQATGKAAAAKKAGTAAAAKTAAPAVSVQEIDDAGLAAILKREAEKGRPLLVNFWATWCGPCREEFPDLVRVDEEFGRGEDFEFITVTTDDVSELKTGVPEFLTSMHAESIPSYLLNAKDPEAAIAVVDKDWHGELPATFLYGRKGELLYRKTGRVKPDELRAAITAAMQK